MKKIALLGLILVLISVAATAQHRLPGRNNARAYNNRITVPERQVIRKDMLRVRIAQRMAQRDGVVTPAERMRIQRLKSNARRDVVRFRYN
jgi:hypothetical protein